MAWIESLCMALIINFFISTFKGTSCIQVVSGYVPSDQ